MMVKKGKNNKTLKLLIVREWNTYCLMTVICVSVGIG